MLLGTISPTSGPPGTEVTVQVQDFPGDNTTDFAAYLGDTPLPDARVEQGESELVFDAPEDASSGVITLAVDGDSAQTTAQFTVKSAGSPRFTLAQPESAPPGIPLVVSGINLSDVANVGFRNAEGATRYATPTQTAANRVRVTIPALDPGEYTLGGRVTNGQTFFSTIKFTVLA